MANTRELSQLASLIHIIDQSKSIGVVTEYPDAKVGIGTLVPTSKVDVVGDVNVSGAITATSFYGDGSNLQGISAGFGPEDSINTTGIITASSFYGDGSNLSGIATFSGDYNDLTNKPQIPSDTGDLTNNAGFVNSSIVVGLASEGYVTQQISNLVAGAPEALDTLNELAAALNDDQNFATTITNSLVGLASEGYVNNLVAISTFSGDYNDLSNQPSIPSVVGLASEGYVDVAVANLVDSAPSTLDTLNELAAALGDDANFSTTVTNSLANKADLSGANFTGVVTATTFYGDGSNLSNIISGVGINSNGVIVGTGITTLNFLGTGTTISISGNTADISVSSSSIETSPGKSSNSFTASEGQTTFSVLYSVGYIDVYLNGVRLSSNEFTADTGDSVILNEGASAGDVLDVIEYTMGKGDRGDAGPSGPLEVETASNDNTYNPVFALGTGTTTAFTNSNLSYNPSTGSLSAVDFDSTSDINLKENIQIIENSIEKVLQLNGITFNWKSSQQSSAGVIAQEVEKILPEIVRENDGHKSVSYNGLIGLLIEVVKNQQEQINTLSNRIGIIEGNN